MTDLIDQPTLWASQTVVPTRRQTKEESFRFFLRRHPGFMREVAKICHDHQMIGRRPSTKAAFEVLRGRVDPATGKPYRLDSTWASMAADLMVQDFPDINIERRKRRTA